MRGVAVTETDEKNQSDALEDHHEVLTGLVTALLDSGRQAVLAEWWSADKYRPARTIDSHVRAGELKTFRSRALP